MRPIDERLDTNFMQALKCLGYRLPDRHNLKRAGYIHALGFRYGVLGAAAAHQLLVSCENLEEPDALSLVHSWPMMIEEHARHVLMPRVPFQVGSDFAPTVSRLGYEALQSYLALYRRLCPLDCALSLIRDDFLENQSGAAGEGWFLWQRSKAKRAFREAADESVRFALHFYDRREAELEELPEIALIGE
jgi:hypothetical protein